MKVWHPRQLEKSKSLELPAKQQCQFRPFSPIFEVNGLDLQCYLAGSSKTAPRILILFNCNCRVGLIYLTNSGMKCVGGVLSYPPAPTFRRPVLSKAWRLEKADTNKKCIQEKGQGRARAHRSNNGVKKSYEVASDIRTPLRMKNCYILAKERPQL